MTHASLTVYGPAQAPREQQRTLRFDTAPKCRQRGIELDTIIYVGEPKSNSLHGHLSGELSADDLKITARMVSNAFERRWPLRIVDHADQVLFSNDDEITHVSPSVEDHLKLRCCPSIPATTRDMNAANLTMLFRRQGLDELTASAELGGRNDTIYGLLTGDFTQRDFTHIGIAVRSTFGCGYHLILVNAQTQKELFRKPASS